MSEERPKGEKEIAQELRRAEIAVRIRRRVESSGQRIRVLEDENDGAG